MKIKIVTIVGARPQFIKAATVSRAILNRYTDKIEEVIVHTGQHYDDNMSKVFFDELDIPRPKYNLEISGGQHGAMTGRMLEAVEKVLLEEDPDWVMIYGDTNSTLAGALAAAKLHITLAHIEAGLRSFNMRMPEEVNRILSDRVSNLLFCPTETSVKNLNAEGVIHGVYQVGDVMYDASLYYKDKARKSSAILANLKLTEGGYVLATCHRAENTDDPIRLKGIIDALIDIALDMPVILPLHPRTKSVLLQHGYANKLSQVTVISPVSFVDMIRLEQSAYAIITDSGGVQKEAYFYGVPCLTMRDQTEWVETIDTGWNQLVGAHAKDIVAAFKKMQRPTSRPLLYGDGQAAEKIISRILFTNGPTS